MLDAGRGLKDQDVRSGVLELRFGDSGLGLRLILGKWEFPKIRGTLGFRLKGLL